jgi:transcriptional regulator with XRE-family HTH domain
VEAAQAFPAKLRAWRTRRGLSQLELSGRAGISQRHLSFLELGRAAPSREMVMRLATTLELPLRQHNAMLLAAGFAPVWRQTDLSAPELVQVSRAVDFMLRQQEPFPAVAVDRQWNLVRANGGAVRLMDRLVGPLPPGTPVNLADALVDVLRPFLVNWAEVVRYFVRSIAADAAADGSAQTAALLERLLGYDGVRVALDAEPAEEVGFPVLPMHFRTPGFSLSLFTAIASLGSPQDITLQELRVESFFPLDEQTAEVLQAWAAAR